MQFTANELRYTGAGTIGLKGILQRNGFGLVESMDARGDVVLVEVWTEATEEGVCGFPCGRATKDFGSFGRFTLMLDEGDVGRSRIHGVFTDILNEFVK